MLKRVLNILLLSIICAVFDFIGTLLLGLFLRGPILWDFSWRFLLVMLFLYPIAFGIFGYFINKSLLIPVIIYSIITYIFFIWLDVSIGNRYPNEYWSLEAFLITSILTFECFAATFITKLIIKRKIKL